MALECWTSLFYKHIRIQCYSHTYFVDSPTSQELPSATFANLNSTSWPTKFSNCNQTELEVFSFKAWRTHQAHVWYPQSSAVFAALLRLGLIPWCGTCTWHVFGRGSDLSGRVWFPDVLVHIGQLIRGEQEKHRVFDEKSRKSSGFGDTYHI